MKYRIPAHSQARETINYSIVTISQDADTATLPSSALKCALALVWFVTARVLLVKRKGHVSKDGLVGLAQKHSWLQLGFVRSQSPHPRCEAKGICLKAFGGFCFGVLRVRASNLVGLLGLSVNPK